MSLELGVEVSGLVPYERINLGRVGETGLITLSNVPASKYLGEVLSSRDVD
ncbi:hypothetical protein PGB90_000039 [Kerria lacca]